MNAVRQHCCWLFVTGKGLYLLTGYLRGPSEAAPHRCQCHVAGRHMHTEWCDWLMNSTDRCCYCCWLMLIICCRSYLSQSFTARKQMLLLAGSIQCCTYTVVQKRHFTLASINADQFL